MKLKGKVAVMTGGEGPLGRVVCRKFLAEGARLAISWYASHEWEEAKSLIGAYREQFIDVQVDASKEEQVSQLMKKVKDTFGSIDMLLHMVGMYYSGNTIWETDSSTYDRLMEVNLKSAFLACKHALGYMLERGKGRIILFPARIAVEPQPKYGAYAISKAGLVTLTQALREELKGTRITVNALMPSVMDTFRTRRIPHAAVENWVKLEEVADLLCSVCSDDFDMVSGSVLKVFGKL
ncbi:MAG TPA: SDR family NAD(P)-dependent oxidoreductase [Thermodesulfobacteriota bacterium]|nr:SDR family NAD(P)-dependent oxidoreductase [Thermodesulfobacteriota bacterium]